MSAADFDARYRTQGDPWCYRTSPYEQAKYAATLAACGPGPFSSALELGGSIGTFSAMLAPLCVRLTTLDFSAAAVASAKCELAGFPQVRPLLGEIPGALEDGAHDLIVASEVLYYLEPEGFVSTLERLEELLIPGGASCWCTGARPDPSDPSPRVRCITT